MICEKCKREMKKGTVNLKIGGIAKKGFFLHTIAGFSINNNIICDSTQDKTIGWYCPYCDNFIALFNVENQYRFEEGFNMDFNEECDCLPQKNCPGCNAEIDIDYPKCPDCGYDFDSI